MERFVCKGINTPLAQEGGRVRETYREIAEVAECYRPEWAEKLFRGASSIVDQMEIAVRALLDGREFVLRREFAEEIAEFGSKLMKFERNRRRDPIKIQTGHDVLSLTVMWCFLLGFFPTRLNNLSKSSHHVSVSLLGNELWSWTTYFPMGGDRLLRRVACLSLYERALSSPSDPDDVAAGLRNWRDVGEESLEVVVAALKELHSGRAFTEITYHLFCSEKVWRKAAEALVAIAAECPRDADEVFLFLLACYRDRNRDRSIVPYLEATGGSSWQKRASKIRSSHYWRHWTRLWDQ